MMDISFLVGIALGTIVTGFCAIGSYNRGSDSVRRRSWTSEHAARKRVAIASRAAALGSGGQSTAGIFHRAS